MFVLLAHHAAVEALFRGPGAAAAKRPREAGAEDGAGVRSAKDDQIKRSQKSLMEYIFH